VMMMMVMSQENAKAEMFQVFTALTFLLSFYMTHLLPFDFRADIDRMAEIKALPLSPTQVAIGELLTPVAFVCLLQWCTLTGIALAARQFGLTYWAAVSLTLPVSLLLLEIENTMFLWFPTRMTTTSPGDIQTMGRVLLLLMAKGACLAIAIGSAGTVAAVAYYLSGQHEAVALIAGWVVISAEVIGLLPLVALAFRQFDVARDVPP
jgi:hypothetical protein